MIRNRRRTVRSGADLVAAGLRGPSAVAAIDRIAARYAVAVTPALVDLIDPADAADPIARQFLPDPAELVTTAAERSDPIGDDVHEKLPGVVHRYPDRVLLKPLHTCPVYCRFCFRREVVGQGKGLTAAELERAYAYIRADKAIFEVILTGGDPLILSPRRLGAIVRALGAIEHVSVIRIHSRVPVAEPERVTDALVASLATDKALFVALHCNHARELSASARAACRRIVAAGIPMLGQTVLLKGVNDSPEALEALLRALVATRIKPYYLHHADLAPGTARFRTGIAEGQALMRALRGRVSGLAQPTYVLDIPGGFGKVPIGPCYLSELADGATCVEDPSGRRHRYAP
ncbi:MAG: lysine-2,3-aminomutase-like protein [Alphaproteobacteria bacterium]|nr:lysine-2,3-aminomutase-like protein [Alphaproteobacteria bacterium]